jgi:hypothetical protein
MLRNLKQTLYADPVHCKEKSMKNYSTLFNRVPLAIVAVGIICVMVLGMHSKPSSHKSHTQNLTDVENKTKSLEVVSLVQNDDIFVLSLK